MLWPAMNKNKTEKKNKLLAIYDKIMLASY